MGVEFWSLGRFGMLALLSIPVTFFGLIAAAVLLLS